MVSVQTLQEVSISRSKIPETVSTYEEVIEERQTTKPYTISELITSRASTSCNEPILGYPIRGVEYIEYTFGQLDNFTSNAASYLASQLPLRSSSRDGESVVAILGPSSLDYLITVLALSRLGFTVLFLSTRLSEAAYVSLLNATNCHHICIESSFQKMVSGVQSHVTTLKSISVVSNKLYAASQEADTTDVVRSQQKRLSPAKEAKKTSWIIHSSGSTGLPKPIYQTHEAALRNYENNMNMRGFITLPLFHAHGLSSVFRAFTSCQKIFMYNADIPLTSQNLLDIMRAYNFQIFYGVPYALKLLSETEEGVMKLADMEVVMFGGSACPDGLGDFLVQRGVNLISHYGTTETGQLMTSFRPRDDKAWNYVRVHAALQPFVRFEERGGNLHELVVLDGWPSKVASNREDGSYATKDLFEPHPSISGAWKYRGRLDDTIVLINGEKAIPVPMEMAVRQHALVKDALVFGAGRARLGIAIVASEAASQIEPRDIVDKLWSTIEEENSQSPTYATIAQEMILVLPAGSPYPQTDKGTAIRQGFYKTFADHIDKLYQQLESMSGGTTVMTEGNLRQWLRDQIFSFSPHLRDEGITDETDLFSLGIDSLQSSRLRGKIVQEIQLNGNKLSNNIVFEYPSITKLARAITYVAEGADSVSFDVEAEMTALIEKYGRFPQYSATSAVRERSIVVVTGATGSLGAHVVSQLALRPDIDEVCCLVRAFDEETARARVFRSMNIRGVLHALSMSSRRKITALPSDLGQTNLGLSDETHRRLRRGLKSLIHCAWSVNFNKRLSSFENDCIAGAKNLMLLCLTVEGPQPVSFNFCSSVSTVARTSGSYVPESLPASLKCAQGMGYAQSKLVTEHLVQRASEQTGMAARVLRVGQIVADTEHGIWNDTEAIPLMLQSATTIRALPVLDENPRWLAVDVVARAVTDIALSQQPNKFFNIVNPNAFHWTRDLLPALAIAGLDFEKIGQREWINRLRSSDQDVAVNPTYKLLDFFASKYDRDSTTTSGLTYETQAVQSVSPTFSATTALSQDLVNKFIKYFLAGSWAECRKHSISEPQSTTLIVLAGPCGSGKSSIAQGLAERLCCPSIEGDAHHDAIAIAKMTNGTPLSSLDRQIWLARVKIAILECLRASSLLQTLTPRYIILTCSALRQEHRAALRRLSSDDTLSTQFVMLEASEQVLVRRVAGRRGHYMKSSMVSSQLEALERPQMAEKDVMPVDTEISSTDALVKEICDVLNLM